MAKSLSLITIILLYCFSYLQAQSSACNRTCGKFTFNYPFTISGQNCTGLPGFEIGCSTVVKEPFFKKANTPYLFPITPLALEIVDFSYNNISVVSDQFFALPCPLQNVTKRLEIGDERPFKISEKNKFVTVGCNTKAQIQLAGGSQKPFTASWESWCPDSTNSNPSSKRPLPCNENGCNYIPLPQGFYEIILWAELSNNSISSRCNDSGSAVVDPNSWEKIQNSPTTNLSDAMYPMSLDWAIESQDNCSILKKNSSYECAQDAECEDLYFGYVCKCPDGYDGDGYINGTGCTTLARQTECSFGALCKFQTLSVITGASGAFVIGLLGGGAVLWALKRRNLKLAKQRNFDRNGGAQLQRLLSSRGVQRTRLFNLDEIENATNNFSQSLVLGTGGYGTVYKGTMNDGTIVAVKKSKEIDSKEIDQFINEVLILSQINHRNVVKLLGCCLETPVPLLVYEYISNGTLFELLHSDENEHQHLGWEDRLRIATETAEALSYLHSAASMPVVHRDVKSSNILLDDAYNPKVADFGVSRLVPMGQTHVTTVVQGTLGYLDPEYFQTVQLTEKSDVYSFGVVMVELLTGLKPVSYERMKNQSNLAIFFLSTLKSNGLIGIIDPRLNVEESRNMESMRRVAYLAKECLSVEGEKRPTMKEVVHELLWTRNGTRNHSWLDVDEAENEEELISLITDDLEQSDEFKGSKATVKESESKARVSFSIENFRDSNNGR